MAIAQSVQASDAAYQWAYELAKLHESLGEPALASQSYQNAISALSAVREDLTAVNSELRFNFKEKIEPVYRDYIQFLANQGEAELFQAVNIHNSLQLAQLENFLRCGRLTTPAAQSLGERVVVHVINLSNTIEVIVSQGNEFHSYSAPVEKTLRSAENLYLNIQSPAFLSVPKEDFLPYSQTLFDSLIRPAMNNGWISAGDHITFVLDAPFQAIPMGLLHNGE